MAGRLRQAGRIVLTSAGSLRQIPGLLQERSLATDDEIVYLPFPWASPLHGTHKGGRNTFLRRNTYVKMGDQYGEVRVTSKQPSSLFPEHCPFRTCRNTRHLIFRLRSSPLNEVLRLASLKQEHAGMPSCDNRRALLDHLQNRVASTAKRSRVH